MLSIGAEAGLVRPQIFQVLTVSLQRFGIYAREWVIGILLETVWITLELNLLRVRGKV